MTLSVPGAPLNSSVSVPSWPSITSLTLRRCPSGRCRSRLRDRRCRCPSAVDGVVAVAALERLDLVRPAGGRVCRPAACRCRRRRRAWSASNVGEGAIRVVDASGSLPSPIFTLIALTSPAAKEKSAEPSLPASTWIWFPAAFRRSATCWPPSLPVTLSVPCLTAARTPSTLLLALAYAGAAATTPARASAATAAGRSKPPGP